MAEEIKRFNSKIVFIIIFLIYTNIAFVNGEIEQNVTIIDQNGMPIYRLYFSTSDDCQIKDNKTIIKLKEILVNVDLKDNGGHWNLHFVIDREDKGKELYSTYRSLKNIKNKSISKKYLNEKESELYMGLNQALNNFIKYKFNLSDDALARATSKNCTCYNESYAYYATFFDEAAIEEIFVFYYFLENSPNHIISYAEMDNRSETLNFKRAFSVCKSAYVVAL